MDKAEFWSLIDATRPDGEDPDAHMAQLTGRLQGLQEAEIFAFDRLFTEYWHRAYTWDLWAAAYLIGGGCSDDGFMDFRAWLVSKGEAVFEAALADPDSLAELLDLEEGDGQVEGFQYLPARAWAHVTGRDPSEFPANEGRRPEEPLGESWEDDDLPARMPRLAERFG